MTLMGKCMLSLFFHRCSSLKPRSIGSGKLDGALAEGMNFHIGGKDIEIDCSTSRGEFLSGTCFGRGLPPSSSQVTLSVASKQPKFVPPQRSVHVASTSRVVPLNPTALTTTNKSNLQPPSRDEAPTKVHWTANWYARTQSITPSLLTGTCRRKQQTRKNKTWDGDAYISLVGNQLRMISDEGKL